MTSEEKSDDADSERGRLGVSINMIGVNIAIFTFLLLLFYTPSVSLRINSFLFQISLGTILAADFAFGISAIYSNLLLRGNRSKRPKVPGHIARSTDFLTLGLLILFLEPTFILLSVGLYYVTLVS